jgi:preprotein translocase subunit SecF
MTTNNTQHKFFKIIGTTDIDFIGKRRMAMLFSGIVLVAAIAIILTKGINWGLDFTGGTIVEVGFPDTVAIDDVRSVMDEAGFLGAEAQHYGKSSDVIIRIPPTAAQGNNAEVSTQVLQVLTAMDANVEMRSVGFVGPKVGGELVEKGSLALLFVVIGVLIYVAIRFEWRLAVGTIVALVHDPLIVLGVFSLFQWEFNLTVLAALLAVLGYSVNDSVVVLDRIRENFRVMRKGTTVMVMNKAINDTLSRTLITSGTTLMATLILLFFGGPVMRDFALALTVGIFVGTYSSIYIASSIALELGLTRENLLPEAKPVDYMP